MPLNVLVMPLSRYYAGDFPAARPDNAMPLPDAQQVVNQICDMLSGSLAAEVRWEDRGETVVADQLPLDHWHALRAYAADLTQPVPDFRFGPEAHRHPGLVAIWNGTPSPYVHLIVHQDHQGYYFPADFAAPMVLPIYPNVEESMQPIVGSSHALLRELDDLGHRLGLSRDQGQDGWTEQFESDDPYELVKWGWVFLHQCARLSVEHRLPIIFHG